MLPMQSALGSSLRSDHGFRGHSRVGKWGLSGESQIQPDFTIPWVGGHTQHVWGQPLAQYSLQWPEAVPSGHRVGASYTWTGCSARYRLCPLARASLGASKPWGGMTGQDILSVSSGGRRRETRVARTTGEGEGCVSFWTSLKVAAETPLEWKGEGRGEQGR